MTIWAFGDSYIENKINVLDNQYDNQWIKLLSYKLKHDLKHFGLGGSSLDWLYKNFTDNLDNFKRNDILIIALTNLDRKWLFKDYPNKTHIRESPNNNSEETLAIKYYTVYLDNPIPYNYYLINFMHLLNLVAEKKDLHIIVINCFPDTEVLLKNHFFTNLNIAEGNLITISYNEYDDSVRNKKEILEGEFLVNHMLYSNHKILAEKLYYNIIFKDPIDLNKDFKNKLIKENSFTDVDFCRRENFNRPLNLLLPHCFEKEFVDTLIY